VTLREEINPSSPWTLSEIQSPLFEGLVAALEYVHSKRAIHTDLRPENISLRQGTPLIFGGEVGVPEGLQARALGEEFLPYAAPEQVAGKTAGPPANVWSLGVILYELLSGGDLPFSGITSDELSQKICSEPATPIRRRRPGLSPDIEGLVQGVLKKDPQKRPTLRMLAEALERMAKQA
jgi:serine/threonine protein kinase